MRHIIRQLLSIYRQEDIEVITITIMNLIPNSGYTQFMIEILEIFKNFFKSKFLFISSFQNKHKLKNIDCVDKNSRHSESLINSPIVLFFK